MSDQSEYWEEHRISPIPNDHIWFQELEQKKELARLKLFTNMDAWLEEKEAESDALLSWWHLCCDTYKFDIAQAQAFSHFVLFGYE